MSKIALSIVSHGQKHLVEDLLNDLSIIIDDIDVYLTLNMPENIDPSLTKTIKLFINHKKKGFGENHNYIFSQIDSTYFCVCNPDIRFLNDPFPLLLECMSDPDVGVVAPQIIKPDGKIDDNARYFPNILSIFLRVFKIKNDKFVVVNNKTSDVDWVGGMFMLFRAEAFRDIGGFDEKFFLYFEDVDICDRLTNAGWRVVQSQKVKVIHSAQRKSRKNIVFFYWHLKSMIRYFYKHKRFF